MGCINGMATGISNMIFGMPKMIFYQILVIIAIFFVLYWMFRNNKDHDSAIEILKRRYVNGEISKKEFLRIKKDLD